MADGTVLVEIKLSETQFVSALKTLEGSTRSATDKAGRAFGDLERQASAVYNRMRNLFLKLGALTGIGFGVAGIVNFVKESAVLNAQLESLQMAMYRMGTNAGYTNVEMDKFSTGVKAMGITAKESMQNLMLMTEAHLDLNKATEMARVAQDAAVVGLTNSSEAFARLIHGIQTGNPLILRTMGIMVDFEKSYKDFSKEMYGVERNLSANEKAQARFNAVLKVGKKDLEGIYTEAMKTAGKQMTSTARYIDNVKEAIGKAFGPATYTLIKGFNERLEKLAEYLTSSEMQVKVMVIARALGDFAKAAWEAFAYVVKAMLWMKDHLESLKAVAIALAGILTTVLALKLGTIAVRFIQAAMAAKTFAAAMNMNSVLALLATRLGMVGIALSVIIALLSYLGNKKNVGKKMQEELEAYVDVVKNSPLENAKKVQEDTEKRLLEDQQKLAELEKKKADLWETFKSMVSGGMLGQSPREFEEQKQEVRDRISLTEKEIEAGKKELVERQKAADKLTELMKQKKLDLKEEEELARIAGLKVVHSEMDILKLKTQMDKILHERRLENIEQSSKLERKNYDDSTGWLKKSTDDKIKEVDKFTAIQLKRLREQYDIKKAEEEREGSTITPEMERLFKLEKENILADAFNKKQTLRNKLENDALELSFQIGEKIAKAKDDKQTSYHDLVMSNIDEEINAMKRAGANDVTVIAKRTNLEIAEIRRMTEERVKSLTEAAKREREAGRGWNAEALEAEIGAVRYNAWVAEQKRMREGEQAAREANYNQAKQWEENLFSIITFNHEMRSQYIEDEAKIMELAGVSELAIIQKGYQDRMVEEKKWFDQRIAHLDRMKQEDIAAGKFDEAKYWGDALKAQQDYSNSVYDNNKRLYLDTEAFKEKKLDIDAELAKTADALSQEAYEKEVARIRDKLKKDFQVTQDRGAIQKAFTALVLRLQQDRLQGEINILEQTLGFDRILYQKRIESIHLWAQAMSNTEWAKKNPAAFNELISLKVIEANVKMKDSINSVTQSIRDMDVGLSEISFGDKMADGINKVVSSLENVNKVLERQRKVRSDLAIEEQKANAIAPNDPAKAMAMYNAIDDKREEMVQAQIGSWRKVTTAMKDYFDEGSAGYKALHTLEMTLAAIEMAMTVKKLVMELAGIQTLWQTEQIHSVWVEDSLGRRAVYNATNSIAAQGQDPIMGFVKVAAMTAIMAALLAGIGKSVSGGGGSATANTAPVLPKSTVLGANAGTQSESIQNSNKLLNDIYLIEYTELRGMHDELRDMNKNLAGFAASIMRTNITQGKGFDMFSGIKTSTLRKVTDTIGDIASLGGNPMLNAGAGALGGFMMGGPIGALVGGMMGMMIGPMLGGIFKDLLGGLVGGKTSVNVKGLGVALSAMSISALQAGNAVKAYNYQLVEFDKKGALFGLIGSKKWTEENTQPLARQAIRQVSMVMKGIGNTLIDAAKGLGSDVNAALNYVFPAGRIDLQGLDEEAAAKKITAYFNAMADEAAEALFGSAMGVFQKIGEGMYETIQRLVIDKGVVTELLKMTGMLVTKMSPRNIVELSESLIDLAGSLEHLQEITKNFYDKFYTEGQKFARNTRILNDIMGQIGESLPATRNEYRRLVENQNILTEAGRKAYVYLLEAADMADEFYSYQEEQIQRLRDQERQFFSDFGSDIEKLNASLSEMSQLFVNFGMTVIPGTREKFKAMVDQMDKGSDQYKAFLEAEQSANEFYNELERQRQERIDAARKELDAAYNRENQKLSDAISTASESLNELQQAYDRIANTRKAMAGQSPTGELTKSQYTEALKDLENAVAKSGRGEKYELSDRSLQIFSSGDAKKFFGSQQDYLREYHKTYNQLGKLEDTAKKQLTDQQQMVETLKASQKELEKIYNELVNGRESNKPLQDAINEFQKAMEEQGDVMIDTSKFTAKRVGDVDDTVMREIQGEVESAYDNATMIGGGIQQTENSMNNNHKESKSWFDSLLGGLMSILGGLWDAITWVAEGLWKMFSFIFEGLWKVTEWLFNGLWSAFQWVGGMLWDGIQFVAKGVWDAVSWVGGHLFDGLQWVAGHIWDGLQWLGGHLFSVIEDVLGGILGLAQAFGGALISAGKGIFNFVAGAVGSIVKGVGGVISSVAKGVGGIVKSIGKVFGFHEGGVVPRLHQGGDIDELIKKMGGQQRMENQQLGPDEMMAILQAGELVVPKNKVAEIAELARLQTMKPTQSHIPQEYTPIASTPSTEVPTSMGTADLIKEIRELKDIIERGNHQIGLNTLDTAKQLKRWDGNGMPPERET